MTFSFFVLLQHKVHRFTYAERAPGPTQIYTSTHTHTDQRTFALSAVK